ncbi:MAG: AAA family ATPase [Acidimicrobiales bacterium]
MRVALAGKGGVGKTTITATLARLSARAGRPVVTVDGDSNPNLAPALGIDRRRAANASSLPVTIVSRRITGGPGLIAPVDEVLDAHALLAPDGVRLVQMGQPGHAGEGCLCSAHATVSALLGDLATQPETVTFVDMEASPEHLSRGTTRHADVLLLVTEPYYRSLETVVRMAALAAELPIAQVGVVVNKVRSPAHGDEVAAFCQRHELELVAQVPWSDDVIEADLAGRPLIDAAPDGPAVAAIEALRRRLHEIVQLQPAPGGPF